MHGNFMAPAMPSAVMTATEAVVDFVDHDYPKPEVAKMANNADLKRCGDLGAQA